MGKKTLILSQKQLDEIVGANSAYLDNADSDFKEDGVNSVYTGEKMEGADDAPLTTDKFAKERTLDYGPWIPGGRGGNRMVYTNGMIACSKKDWKKRNLIKETNSDLANTNVSISPTDSKKISATGDTTADHAMNGNISFGAAKTAETRMKNDLKQMKSGSPAEKNAAAQRFQNRGGEQALNTLSKLTKNKEQINAGLKDAAMDRGESNTHQSSKAVSSPFKGTAHSQKNNNGMVTYQI